MSGETQAPKGRAELYAFYGRPEIGRKPDGKGWEIVDPVGYEAAHLVTARNVPFYSKPLHMHRSVIVPFFAAMELAGLAAPSYDFAEIGCFNQRPTRTAQRRIAEGLIETVGIGEGISFHAFGAAFDINPERNPWQEVIPGRALICDLPIAVIAAFKSIGFTWGGDWRIKMGDGSVVADPMHFQWGSL